jgi:hypothetical protein
MAASPMRGKGKVAVILLHRQHVCVFLGLAGTFGQHGLQGCVVGVPAAVGRVWSSRHIYCQVCLCLVCARAQRPRVCGVAMLMHHT